MYLTNGTHTVGKEMLELLLLWKKSQRATAAAEIRQRQKNFFPFQVRFL